MAWITPITDRTLEDVVYALANQGLNQDLKGAWNVSDANRIIGNIEYLSALMNQNGYPNEILPMTQFTYSDLPYVVSKINPIRTNIVRLVTALYSRGNPTILFDNTFDYVQANNLEINLQITNELITSIILLFKYSGTFYSGEEVIL